MSFDPQNLYLSQGLALYLPFLQEDNLDELWNPSDEILDRIIEDTFTAGPPHAHDWFPVGNANYRWDGIVVLANHPAGYSRNQPEGENDGPEVLWKEKYEELIRTELNKVSKKMVQGLTNNHAIQERVRNNPSTKNKIMEDILNSTSVRDSIDESIEGIMRRSEEYWRLNLHYRVMKKVTDIVLTREEYNDFTNEQARYLQVGKGFRVLSLFDRVCDWKLRLPQMMTKIYGDKEVTAERLSNALFKLESEDVLRKEGCWHGPKQSIANDDSLLSCVDFHCWCVDEEGDVNDYSNEDLLSGEFHVGAEIVRRPWDDKMVSEIMPELESHYASFFDNHKDLTREMLLGFIDEDTFPTRYPYVRSRVLQEANPEKYSLVIGSLGYKQKDGSIWWKYGCSSRT
jgi:hypothetical protein